MAIIHLSSTGNGCIEMNQDIIYYTNLYIDNLPLPFNIRALVIYNDSDLIWQEDYLKEFEQLTCLTIRGDGSISNVNSISQRLIMLTIIGQGLTQIPIIQDRSQLLSMELMHNKLTSLDRIEESYNLMSLNVNNNHIEDLHINGITRINSLSVDGNMLSYLDGINRMPLLQYLSVNDNYITTLNMQGEYSTSLVILRVKNNHIHTLVDKTSIPNIQFIYYANNLHCGRICMTHN